MAPDNGLKRHGRGRREGGRIKLLIFGLNNYLRVTRQIHIVPGTRARLVRTMVMKKVFDKNEKKCSRTVKRNDHRLVSNLPPLASIQSTGELGVFNPKQ